LLSVGECTNLREFTPDDRLHHPRRLPLQFLRELGASSRRLLLLHYSLDHRVRRLRAGYQPRLVALSEERRVWSLSILRASCYCHVLQSDAGRGTQQVSTTRTASWSHQLRLTTSDLYKEPRPVERGEEGESFPGPRDVWGGGANAQKILKRVFQMASFWPQIGIKPIFGTRWGS